MAELILHVGHGKCGSSAIQASLYEAQDDLNEKRILYKPITKGGGHFDYIRLLGKRPRAGSDAHKERAIKNLADHKTLIQTGDYDYAIISAESLFKLTENDISNLINLLDSSFSKIHIVAYIRQPELLYMSQIQQLLKADHRIPPPNQYYNDFTLPFSAWSNTSECASLSVNLFDPDHLTEGSVVTDFNALLKILTGASGLHLADHRTNTTLSAEQMIIMQEFRRDFCADSAGRFLASSNRVLKLFDNMNATFGLVGTKPRLKTHLSDIIRANHAAIMLRLDQMFPWLQLRPKYLKARPVQTQLDNREVVDVAQIVENYSQQMVDALKSLIVEYNGEAIKADTITYDEVTSVLQLGDARLGPLHEAYLNSTS